MRIGARVIVVKKPKKCDCDGGFICKGRHGTWSDSTQSPEQFPEGIFCFDEKVKNYFVGCIKIQPEDTIPECKLREKRGQ